MTLEHDPGLVPDDVTPEQIERAYDSPPLGFVDRVDQDTDDVAGLILATTRTPREALSAAHLADVAGTFFGVGMCLRVQRGFWNVGPLWPNARTARAHCDPRHPIPAGHFPPRGSVGFAANHTWMNLGAGLVRTSDFHRAGKVDVALLSRMLDWCGAEGHVWGEVLNGVDVWPSRLSKPPPPDMWTPAERADFLKGEMRDALAHGRRAEAAHLKQWRNRILDRLNQR